jgi:hypothetical protein
VSTSGDRIMACWSAVVLTRCGRLRRQKVRLSTGYVSTKLLSSNCLRGSHWIRKWKARNPRISGTASAYRVVSHYLVAPYLQALSGT